MEPPEKGTRILMMGLWPVKVAFELILHPPPLNGLWG